MTPKEKANELVNKYFLEIEGADTYAFNLSSLNLYIAKQCALIAVDEIIKNGGTKYIIEYKPNSYTNEVWYWEEVKQEIEKL